MKTGDEKRPLRIAKTRPAPYALPMVKNPQLRFWCVWVLLAVLGVLLYWSEKPKPATHEIAGWVGQTMGTTYEVKIAVSIGESVNVDALREAVEAELLAVNTAMSTYLPESEISRFNRWNSSDPFPVSERFAEVLRHAFEVHASTGGAFDPSLGPLIDLWGFGAALRPEHLPSDAGIEARRALVGFEKLSLSDAGLVKSDPAMQINLSAIAKGFGVDRVSGLLAAAGYLNTYVEIGGEVVCRGRNVLGGPWRIGIQTPKPEHEEKAMEVVALNNRALATSGDYRNYLQLDGRAAQHILDPRSGRPVDHDLASISVLAADCMTADALATALYVMGAEEGMAWVKQHPGIEALFIRRRAEGFELLASEGFKKVLIALP